MSFAERFGFVSMIVGGASVAILFIFAYLAILILIAFALWKFITGGLC